MYNTKSNVSDGRWVIMTCQCRFISGTKYTTLVGDIDNGGGYACVGAGGICTFHSVLL